MKKGRILLFLAILLLGVGFAAVATTLYLNGNISISANSEDFDVRFTRAVIDSEDKTSEVISEDGKMIYFTTKELQALNDKSKLDFEVTNNSALYDAEVSIECTSGEKGEYYQITKEVASIINSKTTETGSVEVEKIKVTTEDIEETFTCTLTAVARERTTKGEEPVRVNQNIVNNDIECLKNKEIGSCKAGTEIRYMVNDTTEKIFNVLHDDGNTMTLQQRENTVASTAWYADTKDNTKGPLTVLLALEAATNGWSNVNTINYEMGTTNFNNTNAFTGCNEDLSCTTNTYTLGSRSGKARMITLQEVTILGCTITEQSCPVWMYSYLNGSVDYGGIANGAGSGYLTMSAATNNNYDAWSIRFYGSLLRVNSNDSNAAGGRAVIEVNKFDR